MTYLLDSDSFIFLLRQNPGLQTKCAQVGYNSLALSVITVAEILHGAYNSSNPGQSLHETRTLISQFKVIDLIPVIADKYGEIKTVLKLAGQILADFDLLIAATALVEQRTLVTNNLQHFNRLNQFGLTSETWKS